MCNSALLPICTKCETLLDCASLFLLSSASSCAVFRSRNFSQSVIHHYHATDDFQITAPILLIIGILVIDILMPYWLLLMYWLSVQQYCQRWGPNYRQFIAGGQAIQNAASTEATAGPRSCTWTLSTTCVSGCASSRAAQRMRTSQRSQCCLTNSCPARAITRARYQVRHSAAFCGTRAS